MARRLAPRDLGQILEVDMIETTLASGPYFGAGIRRGARCRFCSAEVVGVAEALGYDRLDFDEEKLKLRYRAP